MGKQSKHMARGSGFFDSASNFVRKAVHKVKWAQSKAKQLADAYEELFPGISHLAPIVRKHYHILRGQGYSKIEAAHHAATHVFHSHAPHAGKGFFDALKNIAKVAAPILTPVTHKLLDKLPISKIPIVGGIANGLAHKGLDLGINAISGSGMRMPRKKHGSGFLDDIGFGVPLHRRKKGMAAWKERQLEFSGKRSLRMSGQPSRPRALEPIEVKTKNGHVRLLHPFLSNADIARGVPQLGAKRPGPKPSIRKSTRVRAKPTRLGAAYVQNPWGKLGWPMTSRKGGSFA